MKKTLFILTLAFCAAFANAQNQIVPKITAQSIKVEIPEYAAVSPFIKEGLIQIRDNNKVAYVNLQGKYVYGFDLNLSIVENGSSLFDCAAAVKSGVGYTPQQAILCQQGRMLLLDKEKYPRISDFCDGICAAVKKVKNSTGYGTIDYYVYLDVAGKEVLPTLHRKIENAYGSVPLKVSPLREGLRAFYDAALKKWGYADAAGKVVIQPKYGAAMPFSEGMAAVCLQDGDYGAKKWGFIDKTGREVIACTYKVQPASFSNGFAVVNTAEDAWSDGAVVFIDKTGRKVSPDYKRCNSFFDGFAYVEIKGDRTQRDKTVLIDKNFNIVKESDFPLGSLDNDMLRVSEKNPFGLEFIGGLAAAGYSEQIACGTLYTSDGKVLFERDNRNNIYNFYDGQHALCRYKINGKEIYGFINKQGEFVIYFEENNNFSFTTPKPQNLACELCKTNGGIGGGGGNNPKPPIPTPPTPVPTPVLKLVCSDNGTGTVTVVSPIGADYTYSLNDDIFSSKTTFSALRQNGVFSVRASKDGQISEPAQIEIKCEICDICNQKSKCYDEYECCDKKNPKSKCYEKNKRLPVPDDSTAIIPYDSTTIISYPPKDPNNKWYSGRITLNTVWDLGKPQDGSKRKAGGMSVNYKMPATVLMCINDKNALKTLYDSTASGLIWIIPDRGLPESTGTSKEFAYYWSMPYSIVDVQKDKISFGAGAIVGWVTRDENDVVSARSSEVGGVLSDWFELATDPVGFFVKYNAIAPPEKPQTANYKINSDGSLLLISSTEPLFDNLRLTPYHSDTPIKVQWVGQLAKMILAEENEHAVKGFKYEEYAAFIEQEFLKRYLQMKKSIGK